MTRRFVDERDGSCVDRGDVSRCDRAATGRRCGWCRGELSATARRDALFCSKRCRQASHRFGRGCVARARAVEPLRLAYADPPYPGKAGLYVGHRDYAGEVDHGALLERLADEYPDGWALSTSAVALERVLRLAPAGVRVGAWFRGPRRTRTAWPVNAWEPVVFAGGRQVAPTSGSTARTDALIHVARPRLTDPERVIGAKPAAFCWWLFDLLGALPGDELSDLFPGSGGVARAWQRYTSSPAGLDGRRAA